MTLIRNLKAYAPLIFFALGFVFDAVTLDRVDDYISFVLFTLYIGVSFICLKIERDKVVNNPHPLLRSFIHFENEIFHFAQGSLLSAFTVIYFKSASLSTSFIFLLIFILILVANEIPLLQKQDKKIKAILFHLTTMSFCLIYIPMMIGVMNTWVTLGSIGVFLALTFAIHKTLHFNYFFNQARALAACFLVLYLLGMTPPVPLSLKFAGIYHKIDKKYPKYILHDEKAWWRFWHNGDQYFKAKPGDKIYFFTRIFAPRGFKDKLYVRWEFYINGKYQTSDRIPLPILGGRGDGYRGFTYKSNYPEGDGRVVVETTDGKEVGRISFEVVKTK